MIPAIMPSVAFALGSIVYVGGKSPVIAPLAAVCVLIVIAIPVAAARHKLHMAGYIGIAIAAFFASLLFGELSGIRRIAGSLPGTVLSIACFLSIAVCVGSILALIFYRDPPDV